MTWQFAFFPQTLLHGSIHFLLTQALSNGHSRLIVHSGLQPGGIPIYSNLQEQTACSLFTRQSLFGPQGFILHGLLEKSIAFSIRHLYLVIIINRMILF
jgi:hypothetical protein